MLPVLYLRTLGATEIEGADGPITLAIREAALLAYLCSRPGLSVSRRDLARLMWPDAELQNARHSLSQLLYRVKSKVARNVFADRKGALSVSGVRADFLELLRDATDGRAANAYQRYAGPFLPGSELGSGELNEWRDQIEDDIASVVASALHEQAFACGDAELPQLIRVSRLFLSVHPHIRAVQIALLEALSRQGHSGEVERLHRIFASDDINITSLPPLESLLRHRNVVTQSATVRFAGREDEVRVLQRTWEKVECGSGQVVVVLGEPGIGKTRLADHFLRRVALRGGSVWLLRCCAATQRLPYSGVAELLRENCIDEIANADESVLRRFNTGHPPDELRHHLTESLTSIVAQRSRERPIAIFVDDVQWADAYTIILLTYWSYRLREQPVMLLLTSRTEEADFPPDWIYTDLTQPVYMTLGRITVHAAAEITSSFELNTGCNIDDSMRNAVIWQSGGRPFLLLEALASLSQDKAIVPTAHSLLSESAESVLRRRFRNLSPDAQAALSALAVWGPHGEADQLRAVAAIDEGPFTIALDQLHGRGIVSWTSGTIKFVHDLMREAAYRNCPPATRALYHRRSAYQLRKIGASPGLIAEHSIRCGDFADAAASAAEAAELALAAHSYSDYEYHLQQCIDLGSPEQQRDAAGQLANHLVQVGRSAEIASIRHLLVADDSRHAILLNICDMERSLSCDSCEAASSLRFAESIVEMTIRSPDAGATPTLATILDVAMDAGSRAFGDGLVDKLLTSIDETASSDIYLTVQSIAAVWQGVTEGADHALAKARSALDCVADSTMPPTRALCLTSYGTLLLLAGKISEAKDCFTTALGLAAEIGDIRRQLAIRINNGVTLLELGDTDSARANFEAVVTFPNVQCRMRGYGNLAILHLETGDLPNASRAAEILLSMNEKYRSRAFHNLGHAVRGLSLLQSGDLSGAFYHAECVSDSCTHEDGGTNDISYPVALLCRVWAIGGRIDDALALLDRGLTLSLHRNVLSYLRLSIEKASLLARINRRDSLALARDIMNRATALNATLVANRARRLEMKILGRRNTAK